jgi:hypothetical protein
LKNHPTSGHTWQNKRRASVKTGTFKYSAAPHNIIPHPRGHRKALQIRRKYVLSFDTTNCNKVHVDTEIDNTLHEEKTDFMI